MSVYATVFVFFVLVTDVMGKCDVKLCKTMKTIKLMLKPFFHKYIFTGAFG